MNKDYNTIHTIEEILFDKQFIELAERNQAEEIERFLSCYPEKRELFVQALILIRHLEINLSPVTDKNIENEWNKLCLMIEDKKRRKRKTYTIWGSFTTVAACAAILFFILFTPGSLPDNLPGQPREDLFSRIESLEFNTEEIQIIAGENTTQIENNQTIIQTEEGNLFVGNEKRVESNEIETEYITILVPKGKRTHIEFSDGTIAWINSGTRLIYPKTFSGQNRKITIDGEIFLDVAKINDRPFLVETRNFTVEVTGTQFNVCSYSDEDINSIILVEGGVEVITKDISRELTPNHGFFSENGIHSIREVDVYPYISWKEGIMQLDGESLSFILKRISRHYGVEIEFDEQQFQDLYKGKLDLNEPVETVLYNLSLSTPIRFSKEEEKIIIR